MHGADEMVEPGITHAQLASELHLLRRSGLRRLRELSLPSLTIAAGMAGLVPGPVPNPPAIEALLRAAVDALGEGEAGKAARHLFGLERGAQLVHPTDLRRRAAMACGLRPETFRKEPERRLVSRIAEEILSLCHSAGPDASSPPFLDSEVPPVGRDLAEPVPTTASQPLLDPVGAGQELSAEQSTTVTAIRDINVASGNQTIVYGNQITTVNIVQAQLQPPQPVRCALPPDVPAFQGRERELRQVFAAGVDQVEDAGTPGLAGAVVHAIEGMPGVGKTALAVHAAHLVGTETSGQPARFPDGQLYLDLRAHSVGQDSIHPADALAALLLADGVDPLYLPQTLDERSALWRDRLSGRRVLLVLDNVVDSAQITPLLPGRPGCLTLVTSRRRLGDLPGAVNVIRLDVLTRGEAQAMFLDLSGCRPGGGRGVTAEAVDEMTALANHLPLAVSLLARVFRQHPTWSMSDLLAETHDRLLTVTAEHVSVEAAFDLSYELLPPQRRQFLRRLALHPGGHLDEMAASVLCGTSRPEASRMLQELYRDHLVLEVAYRRYGLHDLIRSYLVERLSQDPGDERERAITRLIDYYLNVTEVADRQFARQTRPSRTTRRSGPPDETLGAADGEHILAGLVTRDASGAVGQIPGSRHVPANTPALSDRSQALAWLRAERANLLACTAIARTIDVPRFLALTAALAELFRLDGPWGDAAMLHAAAAQAAAHIGDWFGEAEALSNLGSVQFLSGDFADADAALTRGRDLFAEHGDRLGEANAVSGLADVHLMVAEYEKAEQVWRRALDLYQALGDRQGAANTLTDLGKALYRLGDNDGATQVMRRALDLHRELGNVDGEAFTLTNLAMVYYRTGRPAETMAPLERAVELYRGMGDLRGEGNALTYLGAAQRMTGSLESVIEVLGRALELHRRLGHRLGAANAMLYIGHATQAMGDRPGAEQILDEALTLYRQLDHPLGESNTLLYLGVLHRDAGELGAAQAELDRCLILYRQIRDTGGEMEALNEVGTLSRMQGDLDQAVALHEQALRMSRAEKSAWDEALAIAGLANCARDRGDILAAVSGLRQALEILYDIGVPDAAETRAIAAQLGSLTAPAALADRKRAGRRDPG